jgi:hypothetical protein
MAEMKKCTLNFSSGVTRAARALACTEIERVTLTAGLGNAVISE